MASFKVVLTGFSFLFLMDSVHANIVMDGRFDKGDFSRYRVIEANGIAINPVHSPSGLAGHLERVPDPAGSGRMVMQATRQFGDFPTNGGYRSEVSAFKDPAGSERWYSWGYYLPDSRKSFQSELILAQVQSTPDIGESGRRPPTMGFIALNDTITVTNAFDYDRITSPGNTTARAGIDFEKRDIASWQIETGKWTFLDMHVRWAADNTGFIELWKNGTLLFQETGHINTFNDERGLWFKTGTYIFPTPSVRPSVTTYSTGVKIGDGAETFQSMTMIPEPPISLMMICGLIGISFLAGTTRSR